MPYLEVTDPNAFVDHQLQPKPHMDGYDYLCPLCHGHGGWNLELNAYRLPKGKRSTAANRRNFCHFRCNCSQCNGWGWVIADDTKCIHDWVEISAQEAEKRGLYHAGRCWHVYVCSHGCGRTTAQDSSD
jgi:hypothetical protein